MKLKLSVQATLFVLDVYPATADTVVWGNGSGWTMGGSVRLQPRGVPEEVVWFSRSGESSK